jgi:hypothetical protein
VWNDTGIVLDRYPGLDTQLDTGMCAGSPPGRRRVHMHAGVAAGCTIARELAAATANVARHYQWGAVAEKTGVGVRDRGLCTRTMLDTRMDHVVRDDLIGSDRAGQILIVVVVGRGVMIGRSPVIGSSVVGGSPVGRRSSGGGSSPVGRRSSARRSSSGVAGRRRRRSSVGRRRVSSSRSSPRLGVGGRRSAVVGCVGRRRSSVVIVAAWVVDRLGRRSSSSVVGRHGRAVLAPLSSARTVCGVVDRDGVRRGRRVRTWKGYFQNGRAGEGGGARAARGGEGGAIGSEQALARDIERASFQHDRRSRTVPVSASSPGAWAAPHISFPPPSSSSAWAHGLVRAPLAGLAGKGGGQR